MQFQLERVENGPPGIHFRFNESVFKKEFVRAMASHYKNLLLYVDAGLDKTIAEFEILSLTDDPSKWEIIRIAKTSRTNKQTTLGYDVGYWGGYNFSIIADVCVIPRWHPPIPEDFENVIEALSSLNNYMLFDSAEEAENYRQFYKSKTWAEEGDFCIIQINSVSNV